MEAEGEADFRGGGEPCLGHIAKMVACTETPGADGLCAECRPEFGREYAAGVGYLRDALILVAIASSSRETYGEHDTPRELTWLGNYQRYIEQTDRDPVGKLERQGCFQRDETVLAVFGVGALQGHIEGAARNAAIKERFLAIQVR